MATFTVTTAADLADAGDGKLSLREAVAQANDTIAADTIRFASGLEGKTLTLTQGELVLRQDLTIDGDQNGDGIEVTLSGGGTQRILRASGVTTDVTLRELSLANGYVGEDTNGGAVFFEGGSLAIVASTVRDSRAGAFLGGSGGGVFAAAGSRVSLADSSFVHNSSGDYGAGGAIRGVDISLNVQNCEFRDNPGIDGGAISLIGSTLALQDSSFVGNGSAGEDLTSQGGAVCLRETTANILQCYFANNEANWGGAIFANDSFVQIADSTIANNLARHVGFLSPSGGGIAFEGFGELAIHNSTITGNRVYLGSEGGEYNQAVGGGVAIEASSNLSLASSIILGNRVSAPPGRVVEGADISGRIGFSNGHNIFGSDVAGSVAGDHENVAPSAVFAVLDPGTGGGLVADGVVRLLNAKTNPAVSGADPLAAMPTDQLGTVRPLPAGSMPDIGAVEINQALSTTASNNNDVLTGTSSANTIRALDGADFIKGLGGNDTLYGGNQGDLLDGGLGNDKLYGDAGIDLVFYGGASKVRVDLSLATDKATRGTEVDTLYNVEGAIGSAAADTFIGNQYNNFFQGGLGRDVFTGGSGRDTYDVNAIADSRAGTTTRDVIRDFLPGTDRIDLAGIDADSTAAGNQAFRWVGTAALTGPGEVGFVIEDGNTIVRASNDADSASELEIQLTGIKALSAADFYL